MTDPDPKLDRMNRWARLKVLVEDLEQIESRVAKEVRSGDVSLTKLQRRCMEAKAEAARLTAEAAVQ